MRKAVAVVFLLLAGCVTVPAGVNEAEWRPDYEECRHLAMQERRDRTTLAEIVSYGMIPPWAHEKTNPAGSKFVGWRTSECLKERGWPGGA